MEQKKPQPEDRALVVGVLLVVIVLIAAVRSVRKVKRERTNFHTCPECEDDGFWEPLDPELGFR